MAGDTYAYQAGLLRRALKTNKAVFITYGTDWCTTCLSQKRTIKALRDSNPIYDKNIYFIYVDFDKFATKKIVTERGVLRWSTLILLKGNIELGRIMSSTDAEQIKKLLDIGVKS